MSVFYTNKCFVHFSFNSFGLENVRQRLKLSYPNKHELIIRDPTKKFFCSSYYIIGEIGLALFIKAIAIDDEPIALEIIKAHASKVPLFDLKTTFTDAFKACNCLAKESILLRAFVLKLM